MKTNQIPVFIYARKSSESEDRQVLSIDSQLNELRLKAKSQKLKIIDELTESKSAKVPETRAVFNLMLKRIKAGEASQILVWHADRLSRNLVDAGHLVNLFDTNKLIEIITPSQSFKNTPSDKFMLSLMCSQAKLENDNRGINAKRGMKTKAELGWYPAPAPTGYLNTPDVKKGFRTIAKDEERFPLVRKMFKEILKGRLPALVWKSAINDWHLTNLKGRPISHSGFYTIITNSFYCGEFEWPKGSGTWYQGKHEAMISREEFDLVQQVLGRKGKSRIRKHVFDYTGMFRCGECQSMITATQKTKYYKGTDRTASYTYYHCTKKNRLIKCSQKPIRLSDLEDQFIELLGDIQPPQDFLDWAHILTCFDYLKI